MSSCSDLQRWRRAALDYVTRSFIAPRRQISFNHDHSVPAQQWDGFEFFEMLLNYPSTLMNLPRLFGLHWMTDSPFLVCTLTQRLIRQKGKPEFRHTHTLLFLTQAATHTPLRLMQTLRSSFLFLTHLRSQREEWLNGGGRFQVEMPTLRFPSTSQKKKGGNPPPPSILDKAISAGRSGYLLFF